MDLNLFVLINIDIHNHFVGLRQVLVKHNLDISITEALSFKILAGDSLSQIHLILCNLVANMQL